MEFTELPTTQSNSAIVVNEYVFHRSKTNKNGSILWRCQQYFPKIGEEKCTVSCTTLDGDFLQMVYQHNPPTKGKKLSMQFFDRVATEVPKSNQPLQRIWEKTQSKFLREIYSDDIDPNDQVDFEDFALSCPQFDNRRTRLQKIRRKDTPVIPMHPCAFILMPDRTKPTYKKMLRKLKESSAQILQPSSVFVDFEQGAIKAFREEFPGVEVKGCHFHFIQCKWHKIQELGLSVEYKENKQTRD